MLRLKNVALQQAKTSYTRTQMEDSGLTVLEKAERGRTFFAWSKNIFEGDELGLLAYYMSLGLARAEAMQFAKRRAATGELRLGTADDQRSRNYDHIVGIDGDHNRHRAVRMPRGHDDVPVPDVHVRWRRRG